MDGEQKVRTLRDYAEASAKMKSPRGIDLEQVFNLLRVQAAGTFLCGHVYGTNFLSLILVSLKLICRQQSPYFFHKRFARLW